MMSLIATLLFLFLMCLGLPIAASLGLAAGGVIWWYDLPLSVIAQRTVNSLDSTPLLAVPMFILAASIFNSAGITQHIVSDDGVVRTINAVVPAGADGRRFVRLRMSR